MGQITKEYYAGGLSTNDGDYMGNSASEAIGRWWNNLSGKTAQNLAQSTEAQKDREWQEYMSNTAFQRQVADMQAAGLNPAQINADGASTPAGAKAEMNAGDSNGILGWLSSIARTAIGAVMTKNMIAAGAAKNAAQVASKENYTKMMGQYYSARQALASLHESKNVGTSKAYDDPSKKPRFGALWQN